MRFQKVTLSEYGRMQKGAYKIAKTRDEKYKNNPFYAPNSEVKLDGEEVSKVGKEPKDIPYKDGITMDDEKRRAEKYKDSPFYHAKHKIDINVLNRGGRLSAEYIEELKKKNEEYYNG